MRMYFLRITRDDGTVLADYTSLNPDGTSNGRALKIDFDIPVYAYGDPAGNAYIKVSGVNYPDILGAKNLNGANVTLIGGMAKGLPLANPAQAGVLLKGIVQQCFGNWEGREVTLDLIISAKAGTNDEPVNLSYDWRKGTTLQDAVTQTLLIAYPGSQITGGFSGDLVYTEDAPFVYQTMTQFAAFVYDTSKAIIKDKNYYGASIVPTPGGFFLFDGTAKPVAKKISYLEMIGNATWLDAGTMQFKSVLRADLNVGDIIQMPRGSNVINTANSFTQYRDTSAFQGDFMVSRLRHLGSSRQTTANAWVTVADAVIQS